jgi:hypothetical protein
MHSALLNRDIAGSRAQEETVNYELSIVLVSSNYFLKSRFLFRLTTYTTWIDAVLYRYNTLTNFRNVIDKYVVNRN